MALDARDPYTAGHSERVSVLSVAIGRSLRLRDEEIEVHQAGRAAARHRQDRRAGCRAAQTHGADARRVRHHQAASRRGRAHSPVRAVSGAPHSHRRTASRAAGRTRLPARSARRRDPHRRAHRARGRRVRRHDDGARVPRRAASDRRAPGAVAFCRHGLSRRSRRRARDRAAGRHLRQRARSSSRACMRSARTRAVAGPRLLARRQSPPRLRRLTSESVSTRQWPWICSAATTFRIVRRSSSTSSARVQLADRWQIYVRPWFRLPRPSPPTARHRPGTRSYTRRACATSARDRSLRESMPATLPRRSGSDCSTPTPEPIPQSPGTRAISRRCCLSTPAGRAGRRLPRRIRSARS